MLQPLHARGLVSALKLGKSTFPVEVDDGRKIQLGKIHFEIIERYGLSIDEVASLTPSEFEAYHWRIKRTPFFGLRGMQVLMATWIGSQCNPPKPWYEVFPYASEDFFDNFIEEEKERWALLPPVLQKATRAEQDRYLSMRYGSTSKPN